MKKHLEQHQLAEVVALRSPIQKSWSPQFEHDRAVLQCQLCRQVGAIIRNRQVMWRQNFHCTAVVAHTSFITNLTGTIPHCKLTESHGRHREGPK